MKLTIVRHGETIENSKGIYQGQTLGTLSDKGKEQIKKLADRLKEEKFDYVYSSDLERAAETAKEIMKYHPKLKIKLTKDLREMHLGEMEGKTGEEIDLDCTDLFIMLINDGAVKGSESIEEMEIRVNRFIDSLKKHNKDDNILIVCHGGVIRVMLHILFNKTLIDSFSTKIGNASVSVFEINGENKNIMFNSLEHLE